MILSVPGYGHKQRAEPLLVPGICRRNGVHAVLETLGIPVERHVGVLLSRDSFNPTAVTELTRGWASKQVKGQA
jgi:hypothetical protein